MPRQRANTAAPVSKREQNKQDKRQRILDAAREAFRSRGFDRTTLREVAASAGVGSGTVFLYAETKESLLLQVFIAEMGPLFARAFADVPEGRLHAQLMHVLTTIADHHAEDPAICKPFVGQLLFIGSPERETLLEFIASLHQRFAALVAAAQARGEIDAKLEAFDIAVILQDLFLAGLRRWLINGVPRARFDRDLSIALALVISGAAPGAKLPLSKN